MALGLCVVVMLGWSWLIERYYPKPSLQSQVEAGGSSEVAAPLAGLTSPKRIQQAGPEQKAVRPAVSAVSGTEAREDIFLETDSIRARFTTAGGCLVSWQLKSHMATGTTSYEELVPLRAQVSSRRFESPGPLSVRLSDFPDSIRWPAETRLKTSRDGKGGEIEFVQRMPKGRKLTKVFRIAPSGYLADLSIELTGPQPESLEIVWYPGVGYSPVAEDALGRQRTFWNISGAVYLTRDDIVRRKEGKRPIEREGANPFWAAVHNKYFVATFIPPAMEDAEGVGEIYGMLSSAGSLETGGFFLAPKTKRPDELLAGLKFRLRDNSRRTFIPLKLYIGPQDYGKLKNIGSRLEKVIDFGFFGIIALPLMHVLEFLAGFIHNYGFAIIFLTLFVKVILWWPSQWGLRQMKGMQALQPKMKFISEQFKDDPKRKQEEMMRLYKEAGVNPAAGCLPMLLQIPIFFALYTVLRTSIELRGAPFILWINDLSAKDPYYVLPLLVGATMYLQQAMMPTVGDPQQAKMMRWFSLAFILIFINFPAGFMLYFLVQNVTQIAQQWYTNRQPTIRSAGRT